MCTPRCPSLTRAALESEPLNPGPQTLGCLRCRSLRIGAEEEGCLQVREGNVKAITEESLYAALVVQERSYHCRLAEEAGSPSGCENGAALVFPEQH